MLLQHDRRVAQIKLKNLSTRNTVKRVDFMMKKTKNKTKQKKKHAQTLQDDATKRELSYRPENSTLFTYGVGTTANVSLCRKRFKKRDSAVDRVIVKASNRLARFRRSSIPNAHRRIVRAGGDRIRARSPVDTQQRVSVTSEDALLDAAATHRERFVFGAVSFKVLRTQKYKTDLFILDA